MNRILTPNRTLKRTLVNILSIFVILAMALSAAGFALQLKHEVARADSPIWQDDFNSEALDPAWIWVNENSDMWNLTENSGHLRIYTSADRTGGENLLLRSVDPNDFTIETRMLFEPSTNFQFAGLVVWQDDSNFLQFGRAFCDIEGPCVGNGIYFDKVLSGESTDSNLATPVDSPSEAYLRLEHRGNTFWAYYSENGTEWMLIGVHQVPQGFVVNGVGLTASQNLDPNVSAIQADFDYFAFGSHSEPSPRIVHRYHGYIVAEHFVPGAQVTFKAFESQSASDPLFELTRDTDETGGAGIWEWEYPYDLVPGNYLVVSDGSITKDLVLEPVTMDIFNPEADLLSGTTSPDRALYIYSQNDNIYCHKDVTADENGAWAADFSGECNITDDMWTAAMAMDEDGDVSESTRPAPPTGYHDYDSGDVPNWACNVGGWAMDPDSPYEDVNVRILVDGNQVMDPFKAENYREDLETSWNESGGACPGGTCAFDVSLWGQIDSYVPHQITVEAQDLQSGEWYSLNNTPKTLTCRTYDIYTFDPATSTIKQITNMRDTQEYNPRWSPDGTKIVHDAWAVDWSSHAIYITDIKSGVSTPLAGAEGGSYPIWAPNGKWIAFDRGADNDYRIFIVPPTGGAPQLVAEDAFMASWAPDSKRLAFHQQSDGAIHTIELKTGNKTLVVENANAPAWSPDGNWIAFERDGDIWKVGVNKDGNPVGDPIQLTSSPFFEARPTWSNNNKTIAFHAGFGDDSDIWTVPAAGGAETWLNGAPNYGDYDPNYSFNGRYISYSSFSPDGQAPRTWVAAFTYDLPAGYWAEGSHTYHFETSGLDNTPDLSFDVGNDKPLHDGTVLLRPWSVIARAGEGCFSIDAINPNQPTKFYVGWTADGTYSDARAYYENLTARVTWDGGDPVDLTRHEIFPITPPVDWFGYACTFTAGTPAPTFVAYIPSAIEGYDWPMGDEIKISINDVDYPVTAYSEQRPDSPEGSTRVLFELWREGVSFTTGDHIVMTDLVTGFTKDVTVTNLAATDFDLDAGTVSGIYDPNYSLWVWLYDRAGQVPEMDSENGTWVATFDALPPGSMGGATQWETDGDGTSIDFRVPNARVVIANQEDWVDAGITVNAGQSVRIESFGLMNPCSDTYPNGAEYCIFYSPVGAEVVVSDPNEFGAFPGPGLRFMALLGRIGDGESFYIGAGGTFTAEESGTLWLTPNDNLRTDNQGMYSVLMWLEP